MLVYVDNLFYFSFCVLESLLNLLLKMEKVSVGYGDCIILEFIKLNLVFGLCIGLLGCNGVGKLMLIKLLVGELELLYGEIGFVKGIKFGYFV